VQHNRWLTRGDSWGSFIEARTNAAELYREQHPAEARWARRTRGGFSIFMSSSTDPFVPQERRFRITERVIQQMIEAPPDSLILQTHSHKVGAYRELLADLATRCELRLHLSLESDRDRLPGLPPPASSVADRLAAAAACHEAGLRVVMTVSPLLPIERPRAFFRDIAAAADGVVIDHYILGDGSKDGSRTARTSLPAAMAAIDPRSTSLAYRDEMVAVAREVMPGRVGVGIDGFAGRW